MRSLSEPSLLNDLFGAIRWNDHRGKHAHVRPLANCALHSKCVPGTRIGYVTENRHTEVNLAAGGGLLRMLTSSSPVLHAA